MRLGLSNVLEATEGFQAVSDLHVPASQAESEQLLAETQAVDALEAEYAVPLDFGGCQTEQTAEALKRASKGGMLTGPQALAVATMLVAAQRLQRAILSAAKQAGDSAAGVVLAPLTSLLKNLETHAEIVSLINGNIQDDGQVRDSASEEVRRTRGRVRALEGRLTNLLKGHGGEVTEQAGRMCVAVAASGGVPKGILLGSSPGGGMYYIEPSSAVPLNNDLGAARGEMFAAEEAVLWRLTSAVVDDRDDVQRCLDTVVWLDVAASRARYSRWVEGSFPTFVPLPSTGRSSAKAKRGNAKTRRASAGAAGDAAGDGDAGGGQEEDDKYVVRLRRLRHPLLLGEWLLHREATRRADKRATSRTSIRRLATRKSVMAGNGAGNGASAAGGSAAGSGSGSGSDGEEEGPSGPVQPVPIDVCVKPEMRAVIITGPNTGGKTASLKAFGLAVLMAKAGLAVPAMAPARLPCYSSVLADIGDEQSLSASLSTFSGHLHRIGAVRREADGKGVVLLDEVGTGTDPGEGAALGVALLRALVQGGRGSASFTLASTHHSALTSLKYEDPRFENASMEFDEQKLAPTYRLLWGIPGRSNALNIAARLGLHPEVVEGARQRLGTTKAEVDNVIVDLEELRRRYEADENAAEQAAKEAARIRSSVAKTRWGHV
ncbi:hypothetical protein WJX72_005611 [[Myrmecia] bisecta]|uniref:DNA mismatch repair proteins mutS family domain-containing protein n=1 Tax=[Myrmecia] bisecta TaxID=41462 RepID=A0AAW1QAK8_9CHLO